MGTELCGGRSVLRFFERNAYVVKAAVKLRKIHAVTVAYVFFKVCYFIMGNNDKTGACNNHGSGKAYYPYIHSLCDIHDILQSVIFLLYSSTIVNYLFT